MAAYPLPRCPAFPLFEYTRPLHSTLLAPRQVERSAMYSAIPDPRGYPKPYPGGIFIPRQINVQNTADTAVAITIANRSDSTPSPKRLTRSTVGGINQ